MKQETGYLETLTPEEREIMYKVKDYLKNCPHEVNWNVWSHWFILRFCRARKYDFKKITIMIDDYFNWGKTVGLNEIGQLDMSQFDLLRKIYGHGYYGVDKVGRPIYIEEVKKTKASEIFKNYNDEILTKYFVQSYERLVHIIFPECSRLAGKRIDTSCVISSLKDVSLMKLFTGKTKAFVKLATEISQNNYPETMGAMYIVNAGFFFSGIWMIIKGWIDPKTEKKIHIISGSGKKELGADIGLERLPVSIGGTCEVPLEEDHGPWQEELTFARKNHTTLHRDRELIRKYYWDTEEMEAYNKAQPKQEEAKKIGENEQ